MGLDDKISIAAKDAESKVQEAEASAKKAGENIKDGIKDAIN